jgi:hypothetical protein
MHGHRNLNHGDCFEGNADLNDCTVLYFSEIKRFREHFEATKYKLLTINFAVFCDVMPRVLVNGYRQSAQTYRRLLWVSFYIDN